MLINANRNAEQYAALAIRSSGDEVGGFARPFAGLHAGMRACRDGADRHRALRFTVLPLDLVARPNAAMEGNCRPRRRPYRRLRAAGVALYSVALLPLTAFLESSGRKIDTSHSAHRVAEVEFDDEAAFANINTIDELQSLERD